MRYFLRLYFRKIKMIIYRRYYGLKYVHDTFYIGGRSYISPDLIADEYSYIGPKCKIYSNVKIGKYTLLGPEVTIMGGDHYYKNPQLPIIFSGRDVKFQATTVIGEDVWIGHGCFINKGINIGDGAIIAANSVVTKDILPYGIYGGNPAKFIKWRFTQDEIIEHQKMLSKNLEELNVGVKNLTN